MSTTILTSIKNPIYKRSINNIFKKYYFNTVITNIDNHLKFYKNNTALQNNDCVIKFLKNNIKNHSKYDYIISINEEIKKINNNFYEQDNVEILFKNNKSFYKLFENAHPNYIEQKYANEYFKILHDTGIKTPMSKIINKYPNYMKEYLNNKKDLLDITLESLVKSSIIY